MTYLRPIDAPPTARPTAEPWVWLWAAAPMAVALALRVASVATGNAAYLRPAAYALCGRAHAIRALAMCWLFNMISPGLAPEASLASVMRYAVLFGAAGSVFLHSAFGVRHRRVFPFALPTSLLGAFIVGHSLLFSPMADV